MFIKTISLEILGICCWLLENIGILIAIQSGSGLDISWHLTVRVSFSLN